jgi:hypothetical protein
MGRRTPMQVIFIQSSSAGAQYNLPHFDPACMILKIACRVDLLDDSDTYLSINEKRKAKEAVACQRH